MWVAYAVISVAMLVVGFVGSRATEIGPWYRDLIKPSWNPPDWVFPVVWTSLYLLIIIAVGRVWNRAVPEDQLAILSVVTVNLVLNTLWSVFFFLMKKPRWALIEVIAMWVSIVAMILVFLPNDTLSAVLLLPYLAWVSVATLLNFKIVQLNPAV